jgi:hypothetical protein
MTRSILKKIGKKLVPCNQAWLEKEFAHLAVSLQEEKKKKQVWFPEDAQGEPHKNNPDDGCGGSKFKIRIIFHINKNDALKALNYNETANYYRDLMNKVRTSGKNPEFWSEFQKNVDRLEQPEYSYIGLAWSSLYGKAKRPEEILF